MVFFHSDIKSLQGIRADNFADTFYLHAPPNKKRARRRAACSSWQPPAALVTQ
jgi:hypothetical protein